MEPTKRSERIQQRGQELSHELGKELKHLAERIPKGSELWSEGRASLGRMQNPVRGFINSAAAIGAIIGTIWLVQKAGDNPPVIAGVIIFGICMLTLFVTSATYHSFPWTVKNKAIVQRIDHAVIFLMVAGTFTPLAFTALEGRNRVISLVIVWSIAAAGIGTKLSSRKLRPTLSATLQVVVGIAGMIWAPAIFQAFGWTPIILLAAGSAMYLIGLTLWATQRPRLAPNVFSYHEVFHVLVVGAAATHFAAISLTV